MHSHSVTFPNCSKRGRKSSDVTRPSSPRLPMYNFVWKNKFWIQYLSMDLNYLSNFLDIINNCHDDLRVTGSLIKWSILTLNHSKLDIFITDNLINKIVNKTRIKITCQKLNQQMSIHTFMFWQVTSKTLSSKTSLTSKTIQWNVTKEAIL